MLRYVRNRNTYARSWGSALCCVAALGWAGGCGEEPPEQGGPPRTTGETCGELSCADDETCLDGMCVTTCEGVACDTGEACVAGECVSVDPCLVGIDPLAQGLYSTALDAAQLRAGAMCAPDTAVFAVETGTCRDAATTGELWFIRVAEGSSIDTRYYDPVSGAFAGFARQSNLVDPRCAGRTYGPTRIACTNEQVTEDLCASALACECGIGETCVAGACVPISLCAGVTCDDGLFCNGVEICDPAAGCKGGSPPCPLLCDEGDRRCVQCLSVADCPDGGMCSDGACLPILGGGGGGSSNNGGSGSSTDPPDDLETSLTQLGVDTKPTPRISNEGVDLPDSFSPFGQRIKATVFEDGDTVIGNAQELVLGGFSLDEQDAFFTVIDNVTLPEGAVPIEPQAIYSLGPSDAPWARETLGFEEQAATTLRDVAAADIDGDGLDEMAIVYRDGAQAVLRIVSLDDPTIPDVNVVLPLPPSPTAIADLRIASGDLDMDGRDELVIAASRASQPLTHTDTALVVLDDGQAAHSVLYAEDFVSALEGVTSTAVLKAGNIDYDVADELVFILNEIEINTSSGDVAERATTRFVIFDDAGAGFAVLQQSTPNGAPDTTVACGNGVCETGDGEDCLSCPQDCNGQQSGAQNMRFCCGSGAGDNPVDCADGRCTGNGNLCSLDGAAACGNGVCEAGSGEDCLSCPQDCNGQQEGDLDADFCCGAGGGDNPVDCADSRCAFVSDDGSQRYLCTSNSTTTCGDGVCEAADGENCLTCPQDCAGNQEGDPQTWFCCGEGSGEGPVDCADSRCSAGGFICVDYVAQVADVTIGDIDDDELNEVIFAGLSGLTSAGPCNSSPDGGSGPLRYILQTYGFQGYNVNRSRAAHSSATDTLIPGNCTNDGPWAMRFVMVNALDLDADRKHELQVNQFVFDTFPAAGQAWQPAAAHTLNASVLFPGGSNSGLVFDRHSARITVSDVDGDGREDIVSYRAGSENVEVYGMVLTLGPDGLVYEFKRKRLPVEDPGDADFGTEVGAVNPILVSIDANLLNENDVEILQFVGHEVTFTEPLVLAALAAPPCARGIGQNTDACTTTWGQFSGTGVEGEREISLSAGVSVGLCLEYDMGVGFVATASTKVAGLQIKLTVSEELGFVKNQSYELTKSVSFETGPLEDSVVFTSIPYDVYTYETILSHIEVTDDPGWTRQTFELMWPRSPTTRLATRDYYNAHTLDSAVKIDDNVFTHTAGEIDSYPSPAERDEILRIKRSQLEADREVCRGCWQLDPENPILSGHNPFRQFDPFEALPGLISDPVGVGQGAGATEVAIEFTESNGEGRSLEKSAELEVELVYLGGLVGFAVGGGVSHSTTTTTTTGTTYVGTVGSIEGEHFSDELYSFGLFTYLQSDPAGSGQEFEVINFWIED